MDDHIRLRLHSSLLTIVPNVYYQPPASVNLVYPCIVYRPSDVEVANANDGAYKLDRIYDLTLIEKDPLSMLGKAILMKIPRTSQNSLFIVDNLRHTIFRTYTNY